MNYNIVLTDVTCTDLSEKPISAETIKTCSNSNRKDSVCTFSCPAGKHLNGLANTIACQDLDGDGIAEWNSDIPSCACELYTRWVSRYIKSGIVLVMRYILYCILHL